MTRRWILACAAIAAAAPPALAQNDMDRFNRQLEQIRRSSRVVPSAATTLSGRTYVDAGAFFTLSYLSLDDSDLNNRGLRQYDLTAYGSASFDGAHDFFIRGRGSYRDYNPGDNFSDESSRLDGYLERLTYTFSLRRHLEAYYGQEPEHDLTVKVGRDLVLWGAGLTLSQNLDAVVVEFGSPAWSVQLLGGMTPQETVDFDGSRPDFDEDTQRAFFGALGSLQAGRHRPYAFFLVQRDENDTPPLTVDFGGAGTADTEFKYDSHYFGLGATGSLSDRLLYAVEAVYQGGDTLSNSFTVDSAGNAIPTSQTRDSIHAFAANARLDYLLNDPGSTRFGVEAIFASADRDRLHPNDTFGGNEPNTVDRSFNGFGLMNTGVAFAPSVSNLVSLRVGAATIPAPHVAALRRLQVGVDLFGFWKADERAAIVETTSDDKFLGIEPDVYLNWQITSDLALALRYGMFIPGAAIENDEEPRHFFYSGVTLAF